MKYVPDLSHLHTAEHTAPGLKLGIVRLGRAAGKVSSPPTFCPLTYPSALMFVSIGMFLMKSSIHTYYVVFLKAARSLVSCFAC